MLVPGPAHSLGLRVATPTRSLRIRVRVRVRVPPRGFVRARMVYTRSGTTCIFGCTYRPCHVRSIPTPFLFLGSVHQGSFLFFFFSHHFPPLRILVFFFLLHFFPLL